MFCHNIKTVSRYPYNLCGIDLESVNFIRDLGVLLDLKLQLDTHIDTIVAKAYKMYGFVMRTCSKFTRLSTFLHIYKSLIRCQLEYAVSIWNPFYNKYVKSLESVQKKFLRRIAYICRQGSMPYERQLNNLNLLTLSSRRSFLEIMLLYDICNNKYDCIDLVNRLCYSVPSRSHVRNSHRLFATKFCRTNAGKRSPMYRIAKTYNAHFHHLDITNMRVSTFRNMVLQKLRDSSWFFAPSFSFPLVGGYPAFWVRVVVLFTVLHKCL